LQVSVRAGVGVAPRYEGSDDYQATPLWDLRVGNLYHPDTYVRLRNLTATSNLLPDNNWRLGPVLQYIDNRGSVGDSVVNRLEHVDESVLLGGLIGYDFKLAERQVLGLEFQGRQDVANDHGFLLTWLARYATPLLSFLGFSGELSTTYASKDYMKAYFGVDARNSQQSGLKQFDADAGIKDLTLRLGLDYPVFERASITFVTSYSRLFGDAKDSPLTDKRGDPNQFFGGVLAGYSF
jgi:outer membrane protein